MFFFSQIFFDTFGHTLTVTSPKCAFLSNSRRARDWPMPPPMLRGISSRFPCDKEFQEAGVARHFQLRLERFCVHPNAHGAEFMAAPRHVVPNHNVSI